MACSQLCRGSAAANLCIASDASKEPWRPWRSTKMLSGERPSALPTVAAAVQYSSRQEAWLRVRTASFAPEKLVVTLNYALVDCLQQQDFACLSY